jgi:predicted lipoprotein with Yx(FWY)xxD motif
MTQLRRRVIPIVVVTALAAGCAGPRYTAPGEMRGGVMTDWYSHSTLYTFDRDATNPPSSACLSQYCVWQWPPFISTTGPSTAGEFTTFTRPDGYSQWAYKGKPLYFYIKDTKTGDRAGDNVGGVWHVVK